MARRSEKIERVVTVLGNDSLNASRIQAMCGNKKVSNTGLFAADMFNTFTRDDLFEK
ncbi:MAG: hypothetical protein R3A47_05875 [Polyangiales bacterium]